MIRGKFARDILTGMIYRSPIWMWSAGWGLLATSRGRRLVLRRGRRHQVLGSNYCPWGSSTAISIHSGPIFKFPGTITTHVVMIYRVTVPCVWWHISYFISICRLVEPGAVRTCVIISHLVRGRGYLRCGNVLGTRAKSNVDQSENVRKVLQKLLTMFFISPVTIQESIAA